MNNKNMIYIKTVYFWGFILFMIPILIVVHAYVRTLLLAGAYTPIVILHIMISMDKTIWRTKKLFSLLTLLWVVKYCLFGLNGVLSLVSRYSETLDWLDMLLLIVIGFIISSSFILHEPFFYEKASRYKVAVTLIGILLLVMCIVYTFFVGLLFCSCYHLFGMSLLKPLW